MDRNDVNVDEILRIIEVYVRVIFWWRKILQMEREREGDAGKRCKKGKALLGMRERDGKL